MKKLLLSLLLIFTAVPHAKASNSNKIIVCGSLAIAAAGIGYIFFNKEKILEKAIKTNNIYLAKFALFAGVNPNRTNWFLNLAITYNCPTIAKLLIENGADPNIPNNAGMTPLHWAVGYPDRQVIVQLLLENDADPNIPNNEGFTPLHKAAEYDRAEIVKLLLDHGADPNIPNNYGFTPLHWTNNKKIIAMLLLAGANIPNNLLSEKVALLDKVTKEINARITQPNIPLFLNLHERKNQPIADMLCLLTKSRSNDLADLNITGSKLLRLPSEILRSRQEEISRMRQEIERLRSQQEAV